MGECYEDKFICLNIRRKDVKGW